MDTPPSRSTVPGVRMRSKLKQHKKIVDAASKLLLRNSFHEITTKQVAAEADIGEATLFRYISSKQELLTLVYGDQLDGVLNRIEQEDAQAQATTPSGEWTAEFYSNRVLNVYRLRSEFYLINPANAALYLREGFQPESPESPRHIAQGDRTIRLVAQILEEGQRQGSITDRVHSYIVAQNCHGTYMHEIDRTPVRRFDPTTIWTRLEPRLKAQLLPLEIV